MKKIAIAKGRPQTRRCYVCRKAKPLRHFYRGGTPRICDECMRTGRRRVYERICDVCKKTFKTASARTDRAMVCAEPACRRANKRAWQRARRRSGK